jgi:hypothetical protein
MLKNRVPVAQGRIMSAIIRISSNKQARPVDTPWCPAPVGLRSVRLHDESCRRGVQA